MKIACPVCGKRVSVVRGEIEEHDEPVHVVETKLETIGVYVSCPASGARVEVHGRKAANGARSRA